MLHLLLSKRVKCLICSTTSAARSFLKTNVMWKRSGLLRCQREEIKEEMLDDNVQTASVVWCWILITSLDIKLWGFSFFFHFGGADYARTTQLPRAFFSHPEKKKKKKDEFGPLNSISEQESYSTIDSRKERKTYNQWVKTHKMTAWVSSESSKTNSDWGSVQNDMTTPFEDNPHKFRTNQHIEDYINVKN